MAMEAKVDFMRQVEKTLADKVTVSDMAKFMTAISDVLEGYEMRSITAWADETDDFLNSYLSALKVTNRSQKTIDRYKYVITRMMDAVKVPTRKVTVYHLRSYLAAEKERGIAESTLEGYREIFSAYFNWLQRETLIDRNPMANLGAIKRPKKEKKVFADIDIEKLKSACKCVRDKAIISFLASSGCRISELCELNRDSIDLEKMECVVHGKGDKERTVYIDAVTVMLLKQYFEERKDDAPALFSGKHKGRLLPGGVRAMLKELEKVSGIDHTVHPHKFRRTFATNMARRGMPIQEIAVLMGHEKIETTMKYIVQNKEDIKSSYRRCA